jgi:hypothetical protein
MPRNPGTFPFSANLEGNIRGPIDAKMLVSLQSDLINPSTWVSSGLDWTYVGMLVSVSSDPIVPNNGIYVLNSSDYTNLTNWTKLNSGDSSLSFLYQYQTIQDSSISELFSVEPVNRTIYVDSSGSDITGDGSILSSPFATIGRALNSVGRDIWGGANITISIDSGTFTLNASDLDTISSIGGAGILTLQGTLVLCASGFAMGAAQENDPLTYAVSGGNTSTWTTNQWQFYFLKVGTLYYPITHDTSTTLSVANNTGTGTEIYQMGTIINFPNNVQLINSNLSLSRLSVNLGSASSIVFNDCPLNIAECYIYSSADSNTTWLDYSKYSQIYIRNCFYGIKFNAGASGINFSFIKTNTSNNSAINLNGDMQVAAANLIIESGGTGASAAAFYSNRITTIAVTNILKLVNCNVGFMHENIKTGYTVVANKLVLTNTNYLSRKAASAIPPTDYENIRMKFVTLLGAPVIRWFYDPMYEFINLSSGRNLQLQDIVYPEFEQNQTFKLYNNTATDISVGNVQQNKSLHFDYTIQRGNSYAEGAFNILIDNSANLSSNVDRYILSGGLDADASSIGFNALLDASVVKLRATLDSSGGDASIYYNISRVMRTPLSI